jgi:signal transduction histidine kinase
MGWTAGSPGLIGRLTFVLLAALILEFVGDAVLDRQSESDRADRVQVEHLADRLEVAGRLLALTDAEWRPMIARQLSSGDLVIGWSRQATLAGRSGAWPELQRMRERVIERGLPAPIAVHESELQGRAGAIEIRGELPLLDGSFLQFGAPKWRQTEPDLLDSLRSAAVLAGSILVVAAMLMRAISASLRELVRAVHRVGRDVPVLLAARGPREVRRLALAFNAMQDRISRLIADRTQALAAVSHDLRTPLGRLRLRTDSLGDPALQAAVARDLEEMENMLGSVLAYLKGDHDPELPRRFDLVALLTTLIDDATDAGGNATYAGPPRAMTTLRPLAIKRALSNLIANGLTYGRRVRARLQLGPCGISITVDDDGPGILESELQRVLEPFHRLEVSRNRDLGGVGLGLAIVRQTVEREGGRVVLSDRAEGGLRAEVILPLR